LAAVTQKNPELVTAARQYYQCSELMITNGSQAIIKALPALYRQKNAKDNDVYLPERGYKEHAHASKNAGYNLHFYQDLLPEIINILPNSVLVIINPNNPTGQLFNRIDEYQERLKLLDDLLVLDEAFIDVMPSNKSYCSQVDKKIYCEKLKAVIYL
jgi:cobalamin biosynthetic protein CobC